jgi:hypothetical protein
MTFYPDMLQNVIERGIVLSERILLPADFPAYAREVQRFAQVGQTRCDKLAARLMLKNPWLF